MLKSSKQSSNYYFDTAIRPAPLPLVGNHFILINLLNNKNTSEGKLCSLYTDILTMLPLKLLDLKTAKTNYKTLTLLQDTVQALHKPPKSLVTLYSKKLLGILGLTIRLVASTEIFVSFFKVTSFRQGLM